MKPVVHFYVTYLLCLIFGVICVICVVHWNSKWRGGFAWDGSALQFNCHPVMMVTGLVVLYGNAAVLYRIPWTWAQEKQSWKLLHAALLFFAMIMCILGLCAAFNFHNTNHIPNLYSLHSWVGISTATLFILQWLLGLAIFILPCSPAACRKLLKPVHIWMGSMIFIMAIASCLTGINEKLIFISQGKTNATQRYSALPSEAVFANTLGVLITAFGLLVLKILFSQRWQRPEDDCNENTPLLPP
ncbi:cytochrome b ascorbate-dependent protein 3-like [Anguilla anguilla]|uniref:cytochrome b ascorbate-dependent protein 3-like n=1 Tax=Anguilla anguilla TaxID=7936 RepID=UPI0015AFFD9B|nr:cytochrome b ascorbate-dependent protein 3-like [Anguilla anguilla]